MKKKLANQYYIDEFMKKIKKNSTNIEKVLC